MNFEELKAMWPDIHHAPRENCKYCGGTGERIIHLEKDIVSPCICVFVDHDMVDFAAKWLNRTLERMELEELKLSEK